MAFMVEGHFPGFGKYGKVLERAKDYLLKRSEDSPTGAMGVKMYEIGLFTIAMSELWGMTSDPKDNKEIQVALERVVEIILRSQNPPGGWRYAPRPDAGQDTSVTAMVFVSLASAREAGVLVPTETIERVTCYLRDQAFDERRGGFGYQGKGYTIACASGGGVCCPTCWQPRQRMGLGSPKYLGEQSENVLAKRQRPLLLLALLRNAGDGSGQRRKLRQVVSQDPRLAHHAAAAQRVVGGK
jgi:hypothetical protein